MEKYYYNCSICGDNSFFKIYGINIFNVCVCRTCGVVCLNPRMDEGGYIDYYRNQYYGNYMPKVEVKKPSVKNLKNSRGVKIFNDLQKYVAIKSRIIEIGCGKGDNLIILKNKGFNNLIGLEPAFDYFKELQKINGIRFFNQSLSEFATEFNGKAKFDCVILSHMLEHFVEPEKALRIIANIMKPEGVLYILLPYLYGPKNPFSQFCIPHTFYFSDVTLKALLRNSGFVVEKHFESPTKDEIALLAKKSSEHLIPIRDNPSEYKKVLFYLKGNRIVYIKMRIRRTIEELVIRMFGENIYLYIRNFLKKIINYKNINAFY
jgi:SAM-dependent methyltransferase